MKRIISNFSGRWCLLLILALPGIAGAQTYFISTDNGDVDLGLRKTGSAAEQYETVVNLCNINDLLSMAPGTTTNFANFTHANFTAMCPDGITNLQWSVFSSFNVGGGGTFLPTSVGNMTNKTCWYTFARSNPAIPTTPVQRLAQGSEGNLQSGILSVCDGAGNVSSTIGGATNANNYSVVVLEPVSLAAGHNELSYNLADSTGLADFGSQISSFGPLNYSVENIISNTAAATVSDFYQNYPVGAKDVDPVTLTTNGPAYFVGFFTMSTTASLSFTRAAAVAAGTVTASATNGFASLSVTFTNTGATGTSWVWNFGDGTTPVTNTTAANVTHTYTNSAVGGTYTVTVTVSSGGSSQTYTFPELSIVVCAETENPPQRRPGMFGEICD